LTELRVTTAKSFRGRAVVTGMIASFPLGGVAWDYGQYVMALEAAGFEVFYLEDTGLEPYDPSVGDQGSDYAYGVAFLKSALASLSPGMEERWCIRQLDGSLVGPISGRIGQIVASADLFLNVSGSAMLRPEYMASQRKVLIDTDPGVNQFHKYLKQDARDALKRGDLDHARAILQACGIELDEKLPVGGQDDGGVSSYRAHDHFFSYAELLGSPGCNIPTLGIDWQPTRPLVIGPAWDSAPGGAFWTTVMSWRMVPPGIRYEGVLYGGKELEFVHFEAVPKATSARLEVAVSDHTAPVDRWRALGWQVRQADVVSRTPEEYRDYILTSRGEFSVAKNVYAATRSGWFSCRSVCYLAAGLPVVVQDTGFSEIIPTGSGLLAFSTAEEATAALNAVEGDYDRHRRSAREIADAWFSPPVVLGDMLARIGLG
jgi:hypothetical protein